MALNSSRAKDQCVVLAMTLVALCSGPTRAAEWVSRSSPQVKQSQQTRPTRFSASYPNRPLAFEANMGQTDPGVTFITRGDVCDVFLTNADAVLVFKPHTSADDLPHRSGALPRPLKAPALAQPSTSIGLRMHLLGSRSPSHPIGEHQLPGEVNNLIGNDPAKWRTHTHTYGEVRYQDVYPGIDLLYYGTQRHLDYDFILAPYADPSAIRLAFEGTDRVELDSHGALVLHTKRGVVRQPKPLVYQEIRGARREITAGYLLVRPKNGGHTEVVFRVGSYDRSHPLVIDPTLVYSTFLGGSVQDLGQAIAVDAAGNAYVAGHTESADFPTTPSALESTFAGRIDAFVTKLDPTGTVLYSTFLGGSNWDLGNGIAVDATGSAYVTGFTLSTDFPTTAGVLNQQCGPSQAFVTKLDPTGSSLVYSTCLGATYQEGSGIAVDGDENAYVTGYGGFVTKLNPSGSSLVYSTFLGGNGDSDTNGSGIALDTAGNVDVTGDTHLTSFPTTPGAFQTAHSGPCNACAFVAKLDATGAPTYSTLLAGSAPFSSSSGRGIAVDIQGSAYVTGTTNSPDFPTTVGAFAPIYQAPQFAEAFVTKLDPTGSTLAYSTFLSGTLGAGGTSIGLDTAGNAYVTGGTSSPDFPEAGDAFPYAGGATDAFVTELNATGSVLIYSTLLGGTGADFGLGIAVDSAGNAYVTGSTLSLDFFPTTAGAFEPTFIGGSNGEGFVTKILAPNTVPGTNVVVNVPSASLTFSSVTASGTTTLTTIGPETAGEVPGGFAISSVVDYQIGTTATFSGPVTIGLLVPGPISQTDFDALRVLHNQGGVLVDVTASSPAPNYGTLTIYAITSSFSPFYLVRTGEHISTLFDSTKAYKSGSTVPIKLALLSPTNANVSSALTTLTARNLVLVGGNTSAPVIDSGNANPDSDFRYDVTLGGYVFNLSTKGLASGTWVLSLCAGGNNSFVYLVAFEVK